MRRCLWRERRRLPAARALQTSDQVLDPPEPPVLVDAPIPMVAQLAFLADALHRLDCLVDLGVVRLMWMSVDPVAHVVWQADGWVTGTGRGQLCRRDRYTRLIEAEVLGLAHRAVKRRRDQPARVNCFLDQEEPVTGRIVLEARRSPLSHAD